SKLTDLPCSQIENPEVLSTERSLHVDQPFAVAREPGTLAETAHSDLRQLNGTSIRPKGAKPLEIARKIPDEHNELPVRGPYRVTAVAATNTNRHSTRH